MFLGCASFIGWEGAAAATAVTAADDAVASRSFFSSPKVCVCVCVCECFSFVGESFASKNAQAHGTSILRSMRAIVWLILPWLVVLVV